MNRDEICASMVWGRDAVADVVEQLRVATPHAEAAMTLGQSAAVGSVCAAARGLASTVVRLRMAPEALAEKIEDRVVATTIRPPYVAVVVNVSGARSHIERVTGASGLITAEEAVRALSDASASLDTYVPFDPRLVAVADALNDAGGSVRREPVEQEEGLVRLTLSDRHAVAGALGAAGGEPDHLLVLDGWESLGGVRVASAAWQSQRAGQVRAMFAAMVRDP